MGALVMAGSSRDSRGCRGGGAWEALGAGRAADGDSSGPGRAADGDGADPSRWKAALVLSFRGASGSAAGDRSPARLAVLLYV